MRCWRSSDAGTAALKAKKRGRRHETQRLLNATQAGEVQELISEHGPDELGLPFALWSRVAVRDLAQARVGVRLAIRTVSDYLRRLSTSSTSRRGIGPEGPMGFTPQRPIRRASERQEAAVQAWLAEHYPKIATRAKAEGRQSTGVTRPGSPAGLPAGVDRPGSPTRLLMAAASHLSGCARSRRNVGTPRSATPPA